MPKLRFRISMSLDGFVAGPDQSVKNPLGVGGMRLHEWVFPLAVWRAEQGLEGGIVNESSAVVEESMDGVGATIMGRNMFGGHPGPWDAANPWTGWWGENPPYHHAVFVLTHHPRAPLVMEGGTTFTFVTDGVESALAQARDAAGAADVMLAGGAKVAQQYLAAGLVEEMEINLVPTLLGRGERLFEGMGDDLHGLVLVRTVATPAVTHLKFVRGGVSADEAVDVDPVEAAAGAEGEVGTTQLCLVCRLPQITADLLVVPDTGCVCFACADAIRAIAESGETPSSSRDVSDVDTECAFCGAEGPARDVVRVADRAVCPECSDAVRAALDSGG